MTLLKDSGLVIKQEANFYSVAFQGTEYLCTMRANLKKGGRTIRVGDRVRLEDLHEERPVISEIMPRSSVLKKPAVANVNLVLLVVSCLHPDFNAMLVDRLLLCMLYEKLQPVICVNKADLMDDELREWIEEEYGVFPLVFVSAESGEGLDTLKEILVNQVTILAGASGVGKSSLVNKLNPLIDMATGEVNEKIGVGKHTTRHVSLHKVYYKGEVGWVADSPGFSNVHLPAIDRADLSSYYPEFEPYLGQCEFDDCLHDHEFGCAVKDNIDTDSERYYNYLRLLEEVRTLYKQRRDSSSKEEGLTKRAVGKNLKDSVLKLGTEGRARSRRNQKQELEQISNWSSFDEETLEAMNPDEWRI
jgi:ribosome biogenesis GTPase / thiamine phosphate phosphatase